ncbi:hypothetical protein DXU07_28975 [Bradyrhizobium elkanii]
MTSRRLARVEERLLAIALRGAVLPIIAGEHQLLRSSSGNSGQAQASGDQKKNNGVRVKFDHS